jgi:serine/threonine protein phosphatase 1
MQWVAVRGLRKCCPTQDEGMTGMPSVSVLGRARAHRACSAGTDLTMRRRAMVLNTFEKLLGFLKKTGSAQHLNPRTIAIGDIHGCSAALDALLEAIRPRPEDCIVTLGDYINRGPDSRGVIERLMELKGRCRLVPLLGNHDEMLFEVLADSYPLDYFLGVGGDATLDSYGPDRVLSLIPDNHLKFLERCLDYHETKSHIFVHASYQSDLPMGEHTTPTLRWEPLGNSVPEPHVSGKTVIAGHTSQKNGEILDLGHVKVIDTYCYGGGWLTALDLRTEEVWQADREGNMRWRS